MTEPCDLSAVEARRLIGSKALSPVELTRSCIDRIAKTDPAVNAMVAMDEDAALEAARNAEQAVMHGEPLGELHGLPLGIKDLQATAGLRTTWGSLLFENHVPEEDEDTVANLRDEGAIILGKTNTPEFGAGANTKNRVYGATCNPFNTELSCAGSSGGSAVALSLGQVPLATGSDYGGSLRTPSAFCGIVGIRTSPGVVPGPEKHVALNPYSVNGPMGRTVEDAHLLLKAQIDLDKRDPFSCDDVMRIPEVLSGYDLSSLNVAYSEDLGCCPVDNDIRKVFRSRIKAFGNVFAAATEAAPDLSTCHDVFEITRGINFASSHMDRLASHRDLLGPNVIDNTERGLNFTARDVAWAMGEQAVLYRRYLEFFDDFDILICPTASVSPFPHEQLSVTEINGEAMPTYMRWLALAYALTVAMPVVVALPCGVDHKGMPFGIQIAGPNGSDAMVIEIAHALEQVLATNAETRRPVPDIAKLIG
jgi:Asp-tRNA(Asn)/Glu-tRNA(Gln) amidotransferase A subunit family amidase